MKYSKLTEAYEGIMDGTNFVGSAREFRHHLGKALNSLTALKDAPIEDKKTIEDALVDLHQTFNLALQLEDELESKAKDNSNFP